MDKTASDPVNDDRAAAEPPAHPFARYLRKIGRGPRLARPLDEEEAVEAMTMIVEGKVEPAQIGALFLVLRLRAETPDELAGFVRAARAALPSFPTDAADIDWPSYADRHKQLPFFILSAVLLAERGYRVAMHGLTGVGPVTTPKALAAFGIERAASPDQAARQLGGRGICYLPIEEIAPPLGRLFALRPLLGVRSPANTFMRDLNPFGAPNQMQGVFHPNYIATHQETTRRLGQKAAAIFKGGGGEAQRNPDKPCHVGRVDGDDLSEELWPPLSADEPHRWREDPLEPERILDLWRGAWHAPGPEAAVIATTAIALKLAEPTLTQPEALARAEGLWHERDRRTFADRGVVG